MLLVLSLTSQIIILSVRVSVFPTIYVSSYLITIVLPEFASPLLIFLINELLDKLFALIDRNQWVACLPFSYLALIM